MSENTSNYLSESGAASWLKSVDSKRIALMYLVGMGVAAVLALIAGIGLRLDLLTNDAMVEGQQTFFQALSFHSFFMIFLFMVPAIPASLGNFFLPLQLGASNVAFPRLNRLSFYFWFAGLLLAFLSMHAGNILRWTALAPASLTEGFPFVMMVFAVITLGVSVIITGINFTVTIQLHRAQGLAWSDLPLFAWSLQAAAIIQIFATPLLGGAFALLLLEKMMGLGLFDPALGGDALLYQQLFWFFARPALFMALLPAFGIIGDTVSVMSRRPVFGYTGQVVSFFAISFLSILSWGGHLTSSGQSIAASTMTSFLFMILVAICFNCILSWLATLYKGSIQLNAALVFSLFAIIMFPVGLLAAAALNIMSLNSQLSGSLFAVGSNHYLLGAVLFSLLAGLYYWWPKMSGKQINENLSMLAGLTLFIGLNITFLPQLIAGARGLPRGHYQVIEGMAASQVVSVIGGIIAVAGLIGVIVLFIMSVKKGARAEDNPWGASSLEWKATTPPQTENFSEPPAMHTAEASS
ncbi:MAG: cbb3-type cytochrome c oxidase subunit I [Fibrobacteria bacterium]|nr:cbb3-type cytochrome c oxidase subunit I [Fibrobacteria bacterium]